MDHLKEGIGLRSYAQANPLVAYTKEGFDLFDEMLSKINKETTIYLLKAQITQNLENIGLKTKNGFVKLIKEDLIEENNNNNISYEKCLMELNMALFYIENIINI